MYGLTRREQVGVWLAAAGIYLLVWGMSSLSIVLGSN